MTPTGQGPEGCLTTTGADLPAGNVVAIDIHDVVAIDTYDEDGNV